MKNIKIYLSTGFILLMLAGCTEDIINKDPRDQFTIDVVLSDLDGLEGSILGIYERGRNYLESNDISIYHCAVTDLVKPGTHLTDQTPFNQYATFQGFSAYNSSVEVVWNNYNIGLHRCNVVLENIENVDINPENPEEVARKNKAVGEALYFRGYFHLLAVQRYENIILHDQLFSDPGATFEQADPSVVYDLIIEDLLEAIELLPSRAQTESVGQVSKGAARHVLSKAYMDLEEWQLAADLADEVIAEYPLVTDSLHRVFSCKDQENEELIFSWQFSTGVDNRRQRVTQQWYPLYDRVHGVRRTLGSGGRPWARLVCTDYAIDVFDDPNDLRLAAWYKLNWVYDNEAQADQIPAGKVLGDIVELDDGHTSENDPVRDIDPTTDKFYEDDTFDKQIDWAEGFRNIPLYRSAEAYLIAAEAYLNMGQAGQGQPYLDAIRTRAGVATITLNDQNLIDEHARELAHEGHRWQFLKRKGILLERVAEHSPYVGENMLPHHVRWPLPQDFVDQTQVEQNEGYE